VSREPSADRNESALEAEQLTQVVRPFRARIVRQELAAQNVSRMLDALPAAERSDHEAHRGRSQVVDLGAYEEAVPATYVYRLRRGAQEHVGIVGEVGAEGFVDGRVRGHEAVQPHRVAGLVEHFTSAAVRSELVALLHSSGPAVEVAVAESLGSRPALRFTGPDGWEHTVWQVPRSAQGPLCEELSRGVHYIADGHHRVAASLSVWDRAGRPRDGVMAVIYPLDGLRLLAFHRRLVGPVQGEDLLARLAGAFDVRDLVDPAAATGCFGLYVGGRWYDASYRGKRPAGAAGLDVTVLNDRVLDPLLGRVAGPDPRLEIASALSSLTELTEACDQDGGALFALRPPTLDQLVEVADRGEVMPPKTTYFDPKPYAGIFLR
jgi:uncharacterized protein (DUF1015 family)